MGVVRWLLTFLSAATLLLAPRAARAELEILGGTPQKHNRFYVGPDKDFIGENQPWSRPGDWSGMGRFWDVGIYGQNYWQATMVSENYFITAGHVRPSRYYDTSDELPKVRFYRHNDPNGEYWESTIEILPGEWEYTGFQVPGADLWLSRLEDTPPDWVRRYPLIKRNQQTNWVSFVDPTIYIWGVSSPFHSLTSSRLGRNTIEHRSGGVYNYDVTSPPGLGPDEARSAGGDSSYPMMVISPAGPTLYSINSGYGVGSTMLDYYESVRSLLAARGETVAIVTDLLGDLDADYDVDEADQSILEASVTAGATASYVRGDLNRDGAIDDADRSIMTGELGKVLRPPADFTKDNLITSADLSVITSNFLQQVDPFTNGDATGDGLVDRADVAVFDRNRTDPLRGVPPLQIAGDANADGEVNSVDLQLWAANLNRTDVPEPYFTHGDVTGDSAVDFIDLRMIRDNYGKLYADLNGDFQVSMADVDIVITNWQSAGSSPALGDVTGDGVVDGADIQAVASALGTSFRRPLPGRIAGIIPGDFTGDMYVDGSDLLVWQRVVGSPFLPAVDANKNGIVDAGDLEIWATNYLAAASVSAALPHTAAVPEPTSGLLMTGLALTTAWAIRSAKWPKLGP